MTKMEYIPSKFTYSQVLEILNLEKSKSTNNLKNHRYVMLLLWKIMSIILVLALLLFIFWQFRFNNTAYFPWNKMMEYFSKRNMLMQLLFASIFYLYFYIICLSAFYKLLLVPVGKQLQKYYIKRGLIIPNKYKSNSNEIKRVYENIDKFINYITENPELTVNDFSIDAAGQRLIRTIHYIDGDEKVVFYFGPALKEIILEHRVLDFSKYDTYYELV